MQQHIPSLRSGESVAAFWKVSKMLQDAPWGLEKSKTLRFDIFLSLSYFGGWKPLGA